MSEHLQVATTLGSKEDAQRIAAALVQQRLAACVQVQGPVASTYRWQGSVETADEWLLVAKCRRDGYERVQATVQELHPYDEPEIIATAIVAGSPGYFRWLDEQVSEMEET